MRFKLKLFLPKLRVKIAAFLAIAIAFASTLLLVDRYQVQQQYQNQEFISQINAAWLAGNYQDCINKAQQVALNSPVSQEAQMLSQFCQDAIDRATLASARALATVDQLERAIGLATSISADSAHFAAAHQDIETWSVHVWELAQRYYWSAIDQLDLAVTTANSIPERCSIYLTVRQQVQAWQRTWETNQRHWRAADIAIEINDLEQAATELAHVVKHPYWDMRILPLIERLQAKQQQYQALVMEIQRHLQQGELEVARNKTSQLPLTGALGEKRAELTAAIDRAEARKSPNMVPLETVVGVLLLFFEILIEIGARRVR
ncbi:hypothetical protein [Thermocoleostomius sinensis]|uniref:Chromosome segregation ATPase n=1 Tax=Thermocoleostomius sinensis A174 TaxID=2016057 RepID=A0A9E9C8F3_9CYAN|nr:hypothetical protein [Thermocoleostomius sinensis]WAL61354.1 hypothetical protein OXH18_05010 [Thermocoleostomius sinensis A174]